MKKIIIYILMVLMMTTIVLSTNITFRESYDSQTNSQWNLTCRDNIFDSNYSTGCYYTSSHLTSTYDPSYNISPFTVGLTLQYGIINDSIESIGNISIPQDCIDRAISDGIFTPRIRYSEGAGVKIILFYCLNASVRYEIHRIYGDSTEYELMFNEEGLYETVATLGEEENPHLLNTCQDLYDMRNLNSSHHFRMENDISCRDFPFNDTPSLILSSHTDFDGNRMTISDIDIYRHLGQKMGLFGTLNGHIHDLIIENITISGNSSEPFPYSQGCSILAGENTHDLNIDDIGIKFSGASCGVATGDFIGDTVGGIVTINNSYIKNSTLRTFRDCDDCNDFSGVIGSGNRKLILDNFYSSIDIIIDGNGDTKSAIRYNTGNDVYHTVIWSNKSANRDTTNTTEADIGEMMDASSPLWDNFSTDRWKFIENRLPLLIFEDEFILKDISPFNSYTMNASVCDGANSSEYISDSFGFDLSNPIRCIYDDFSKSASPYWDESSVFCLNQLTGVINLTGGIRSHTISKRTTFDTHSYPHTLTWTTDPIIRLSSTGDITFHILKDDRFYRFDIDAGFNGSAYNSIYKSIRRCDGSMSNKDTPRCRDAWSILKNASSTDSSCHMWIDEDVVLTSDIILSGTKSITMYDHSSLDCNDNAMHVDNLYVYDAIDNITDIRWSECILNHTSSSFSGFLFQNHGHASPASYVFDDIDIHNRQLGDFQFTQIDDILNITIQHSSAFSLLVDGDGSIDDLYFNDNDDTTGKTVVQSYIPSFTLMMTDNVISDSSSYIYLSDNDNGIITYNTILNDIFSTPLGDAYIHNNIFHDVTLRGLNGADVAYNNFSSGNLSCWGDCDSDPDIYNVSNFNNYVSTGFYDMNDSVIEYNRFENVTGVVYMRNRCNLSSIRYNTFLNAGSLYLRTGSRDNIIHHNSFHCDNISYGYGCYGIYTRDRSDGNEIYSNNVTGYQGIGFNIRNSYDNLWRDNYINLTIDSVYRTIYQPLFTRYAGIFLRSGSDTNTIIRNIVSMTEDYSSYSESGCDDNNITLNDFYIADVVDNGNNSYHCNTYEDGSILLNATDTCPPIDITDPVCIGIDDDNVLNNTNYTINITCTDNESHLQNFTISCSQNVTHSNLSIGNSTYHFLDIVNISGLFACSIVSCDIYGNCLEEDMTIDIISIDLPTHYLDYFTDQSCPLDGDLPEILGYGIILFFLLAMLVYTELYMTSPYMNVFIGLAFLGLSIPFFQCTFILGGVIALFGLFIMVYESFVR